MEQLSELQPHNYASSRLLVSLKPQLELELQPLPVPPSGARSPNDPNAARSTPIRDQCDEIAVNHWSAKHVCHKCGT